MIENVPEFLKRSKESHQYFCENGLWILTDRMKLIPFRFNSAQMKLHIIAEEEKAKKGYVRIIVLKPRRLTCTTYVASRAYNHFFLNNYTVTSIMAHEMKATERIFKMMKRFNEQLKFPEEYEWAKELKRSNAKEMESASASLSYIEVFTAGKEHSSRSGGYTFCHASEYGFYPSVEQFLNLLAGTKEEPGTEVWIESTANGMNSFHTKWQSARNTYSQLERKAEEFFSSEDFRPVFFAWFDQDEFRKSFTSISEKEYFMETVHNHKYLEKYGEEEEEMKLYNLSYEQMKWRRYYIDNKCQSHPSLQPLDVFKQENPCLTADTKISTSSGIVRIGDDITGLYGQTGIIKKWMPQGKKQIYRLTTENGYTIKGTADHRIFFDKADKVFENNFEPLNQMLDKKVKLIPPIFAISPFVAKWRNFPTIETSIVIDEKWAEFLGYFMGDGSFYNGEVSVFCDSKDTDVVKKVSNSLEYVSGKKSKIKFTTKTKGCTKVYFCSKEFGKILMRLGVLRKREGASGYKRWIKVPDCIWASPRHIIKSFLSALFECDGFNDHKCNRVVFFSKEKEFVNDLQYLLLGFGVTCKNSSAPRTNGNGFKYIANELVLRSNEAVLFNKEIGFISERKRQNVVVKRLNYGAKRHQISFEEKVVLIEPLGVEEVFDIETADHIFDANGILVHNCNEIEAFVTTGGCVFKTLILLHNQKLCKHPISRGNLRWKTIDQKEVEWYDDPAGEIKIWQPPDSEPLENRYAGGFDPSGGVVDSDYMAGSVMDRLNNAFKTVATWHGYADPDKMAEQLFMLALFYNRDIHWCIENNAYGNPVIKELWKRWKYTKQYLHRKIDRRTEKINPDVLGFKTTVASKPILIQQLNAWIRDGILTDYDMDFWGECLTFVYGKRLRRDSSLYEMSALNKGKQGSADRSFDDRVFARALAIEMHRVLPPIKKSFSSLPKWQKDEIVKQQSPKNWQVS